MPSDADQFEADFESFKEFVYNDDRHFFVIQFKDGSGRFFRKQPGEGTDSNAEFTIRGNYGMEGMRKIASATAFMVDETANTQQNLRKLMRER